MNLQEFLEEEFKDYGVRMSEDEDHFEYESPAPSKILDFVNKVLSEVQSEVEKKTIVWADTPQGYIKIIPIHDISTIIKNLKVK